MSLRPRHYVLCAVIIGVFVFNIVRNHRKQASFAPTAAPVIVHNVPPVQTPGWTAFDHAASLRDAPADQFAPALRAVQQQLPTDPNASDIRGCLIWLQFYRQGMAQIRTDPQMKDRSLHHLAGCTKYHLDTSQ
jgi:hypothetical protein